MQNPPSQAVRRLLRVVSAAVAVLLTFTAGAAFAAYPAGVDTSNYQHTTSLNWSSVQASGVKFAFLKATEGTWYRDPYFAGDWSATGRVGIYHGAYHFARPSVGSAAAQATYFVNTIGPQNLRGTLPPVLDLEVTGGLTPSQLITWTHTWLNTVQQLTGRDPIIYTSPYFWKDNLNNSTAFHAYPLWVANYGVSYPMVPGGWPTWSFWQHTSSGQITGISGNVDEDVFNGDMAGLQKFALAYNPTKTKLAASASNLAPMSGQSVRFSGVLRDSSGNVVSGQRVALQTQAPGTTTWTQVGTAMTSTTGWYAIDKTIFAAAAYRVVFAGTSSLAASTSPVMNLTLTPTPTTLSLAPSSTDALAGTNVTFSGSLLATSSKPVTGQQVVVSQQLPGSTAWNVLAKSTTDSTGSFKVSATMLKSASYRAQYPGGAVYAPSTSTAQPVTVTRNPATVSMQLSRTSVWQYQTVTLDGSLLSGATPISGRRVKVWRDVPGSTSWTWAGASTTDPSGHFSLPLTIDQSAGYRVVFPGDTLYLRSVAGPMSVTVLPPVPTSLSISAASRWLKAGSTTDLSGRLTTSSGALSGRTVRLWKRLVGTDSWFVVGRTATLAPDGSWHLKVRPSQSCYFRVTWAGGPRFAASTSRALSINVR